MLRNYLLIALRNLRKQKGYTFINVVGLAVGIACCLLILLYVSDELSYDRFHEDANRIYRVALERLYPNRETFYASTPAPMAPTLQADYPEVEAAIRILPPFGTTTVTYRDAQRPEEERRFEESRVFFADSTFFQVFAFPLLQGDPETALDEPNSIVITTEVAERYFGDADPMGKTLSFPGNEFTVTGVTAPVPRNAHFHYDLIASIVGLPFFATDNWISFASVAYIRLRADASPDDLEAKFPDLVRRYVGPQINDRLATSFDEYQAAGNGYRYFLQPLTDIHLHSNLEGEIEPNGNIAYIYLFGTIAGFILLIACINFMNLSTARSAQRAKEVGVRKVLGSRQAQLVRQFLAESTLLSLLALVLAIGLVELMLPVFNNFTGKVLSTPYFDQAYFIPGLLVFTMVVGLMAGSYPAFLLSRFRPVTVLKGRFQTSRQHAASRNGLVVFQFAVSMVLLVGTVVVYNQLQFLLSTDLGFDRDHVVVVENAFPLEDQMPMFRETLEARPGIINVAGTTAMPGGFFPGVMVQPEGAQDVLTGRVMNVGYEFFETLGIEPIEGRVFSREFSTDTLSVVLNEAAVRELGLADPVGQRLTIPDTGEILTIIGLVEDFHFQSLHQRITPLAIRLLPDETQPFFVAVRVRPGDLTETLAFMETTWDRLVSDQGFRYSFLDQDFEALYQAERTTGQLAGVFSVLAIFIACLGLFGLAAFTAEQRTKEIGIRKVLGASVPGIVVLLSKDFAKLVALAFVIAAPVAYLALSRWLDNFAYRIDLGLGVFVLAGLLALMVALLTISYQSIKAALADPVKALRYE